MHVLVDHVVLGDVVTPRSRNHSTTRSTSHSGAEAPEVMPTVAAPRASARRCASRRRSGAPGCRVARHVDQPLRVRGVGRAVHEHEVDPAASDLTAAWRFVVAYRCRPSAAR